MFWLLGQSSIGGTVYGVLNDNNTLCHKLPGFEFCLPLANQEKN